MESPPPTASAAASPLPSPAKRISFSVDSLLSSSNEERPTSVTSTSDEQSDNHIDQSSSFSGRSTPASDSSLNEQRQTTSTVASMAAAALQQRNSFIRQSAPQIHSALLYPWLMSANLMSNPATLLHSNSQQQSRKFWLLFICWVYCVTLCSFQNFCCLNFDI